MRVHETSARLTISDIPGAMWLLGLVFVVSGTFVLSIPFHAPEWRHFGPWERLAVIAIGLAHLSGGLYSTIRTLATRTEFDRSKEVGLQRVRHLWQLSAETLSQFTLADARGVEVVRSTDSDGDPMYQLRLWLAGSKWLWLQAQPTRGKEAAYESAERVRRFLGLAAERH